MDKGLTQYFKPFTSVKIPKMAKAFDLPEAELDKALLALIADNKLHARIDSQSRVLYSREADQRHATFKKSVQVGERYLQDVSGLLMRMSLAKYNFSVRPVMRRPNNIQ